jgi:Ca-activated chloride channel family protein
MKSVARFVMYLAAVLSLLFGTTVYSQPKESEDRTLSPYFFVRSDDPQVDQLPLKATSAAVNISGVIADVQVTQIYKNEGTRPLEAIYVFPASTKAAVYGMKMTIGERVIHARISKREDARREYEQAREQGRSASLLEQQRPNVFQMNVANIMPGDEIKVELNYTELLVPVDKVYEFVYPTVVGPRYSNASSETTSPSQRWMQNPYLHQGEVSPYTYDITVGLAAGLPIKELECPSHKVAAAFDNPTAATITLDPSERAGGNRDYILRYRLDGDRIQSGLLLHRGERENFFLLMMQPPKRVTRGQIPGREYIFIVDVSGSMHGFPLDISKKLMKNLIGNLLPTDRFNVLLFSGGSAVMSEQSVPATSENIHRATNFIDRQQGGGGTELLPAFRRALGLQKAEGYSRTIVIATDGYVTVEEEVFDLIRKKLGDANVFAFGIGTSVNRHIIEGMARVGMGEPFVITKPDDAPAQAERFRNLIQSPVLTQIKLDFHGFDTYDVEPLSIPDVLAERPVIVFGKWRGQPQGEIALSGMSGNGRYRETINLKSVSPLKRNAALRYLWARHRIALLSDYNKLRPRDERVKEVTELGLAYNLLTAYTSFVAVDSEVRNTTGESTTIKQPLPLPQGVSDYAVGKMRLSEAPATLMSPLAGKQEVDRLSRDQAVPARKGSPAEEKRTVSLDSVTVSEGLSKDVVLSFIQKHIGEMERCTVGSAPRANIVLELTITPDGKIKTVKVVSGSLNNSNTEQCLLETVKRWQFPANQGGREGTARVSLVFGSA